MVLVYGFLILPNSLTDDSKCPMCVQRRKDGVEIACFFFTATENDIDFRVDE
jgi:hypothetical protein